MSDYPSSWLEAPVDALAEVILGQSPPGASYNLKGDGLPFFQGKAEFGQMRPTIRKWTTDPRKVAQVDDVLLSVRAPVGPTNLAPCECAIGRGLVAIRPLGEIDPRYVLYGIRSTSETLASQATGTTFTAVSGSQVRSHILPLAPLNEQRRIVAAIEKQFSRLDAADASLRLAESRLAQLRAAQIRAALTGSWPPTPLADFLLSLRNGLFVSRPAAEPPGTAILRISSVRPLALDVEDIRWAAISEESCSDYLLAEGDLLFTRYSGNAEYVGACARVPQLPRPTLHPDKLIRAVVDRSKVDPRFVELACAGGVTRDEIRARRKTTAGQVGIAGGQLKSIPIPLPPLEEQRRIVNDVERQLSLMDAMGGSITAATRRSATLRRSILERAFRGELVPQDPSDEPASVLLERLAAERATAEDANGRRPRRRETMRRS